jgi:gamma-butyrobetaine dioxygenase
VQRATTSTTGADAFATLARLFASEGDRLYLGEAVTQAAHMLQAAAIAVEAASPDALVVAALLHDVGQLTLTAVGGPHDADRHHAEAGANFLAGWFGPEVTEPVRLHVEAKRYLCAVEPGYAAGLSPASVASLEIQGGPMTAEAAERFAARVGANEAVLLRRWDDRAKAIDAALAPFGQFEEAIVRLAARRVRARPIG